jgi:predicted nucleotidyltransferase component of viral defense system
MISKQDILDRAVEWQLRHDVVEKDYVLGWVLAAIAQHPETSTNWIFKGGTCLKKCYFETYRFSEDLDFTLVPEAAYDAEPLQKILVEVVEIAQELSGIAFPPDVVSVRTRKDRLGRETFEGKIGYRGPLGIVSTPRILFDLTRHEPLLGEPESRPVFHPYPDQLPEGTTVRAYYLEELLAEKTRALLERTRPRDLYDVVFLLESRAADFDLDEARGLFRGKCEAKSLTPPSSAELMAVARSAVELRSEWENMLARQLPSLPPFEGYLSRLEPSLRWIDAPVMAVPILPAFAPPGQTVEAPAGVMYWGLGVPLETARYAGINRLLIEFTYKGRNRRAEPYSLRRAQTGNLLLYAWEIGSTHIKAFNVRGISNLRVTSTPFKARYRIEFSPAGIIGAPPISRVSSGSLGRSVARTRTRWGSSRVYVFQCGTCQKLFRHSKNDSTLRTHKTRGGWRCPGRRGYLIRTE